MVFEPLLAILLAGRVLPQVLHTAATPEFFFVQSPQVQHFWASSLKIEALSPCANVGTSGPG